MKGLAFWGLWFVLLVFSEGTSSKEGVEKACPRDCICDFNVNVARCRSLDANVQHFDLNIRQLIVHNIDNSSRLDLSENIFKRLGLRFVNAIKITNSVIENLHSSAFGSLPYLTSVDLSSTGLTSIPPEVFSTNSRPKKINLSNNPLEQKYKHLLNSSILEELILSHTKINKIDANTFSKLPNLVFIDLSNNNITSISENAFVNLGNLEEVDLSNNQITTLPAELFDSNDEFSILKCKYNPIKTIGNLKSESLETFDCTHCQIREIDEEMFLGVPNLIDLAVPENGLQKIHPNALKYLTELYHIDLSANNLTEIPENLFYNNPELSTINISKNPLIKTLPEKGFLAKSGFFSVLTFDASYCSIEELKEYTFVTMPSISELNLAGNRISSIHKHAFSHLTSLEILDLSNNLIKTPSTTIFTTNHNLRHLNLSKNPWKNLPGFLFMYTQNLIWLDISECQLTELWWGIPPKPENRLLNLNFLNISGNVITEITPLQLNMIPRVRVIDMNFNLLQCTTQLHEMVEWLEHHQVKVSDPSHLPVSELLLESSEPKSFSWSKFGEKICNGQPIPTSKSNTYDEDETDIDPEQSTKVPQMEVYLDEEENNENEVGDEVKSIVFKYTDFTNLIMFIFGALTCCVCVLLFLWLTQLFHPITSSRRLLLNSVSASRTKRDCGLVYKQLVEEIPPGQRGASFSSIYSTHTDPKSKNYNPVVGDAV